MEGEGTQLSETVYGVELAGRRGRNIIYFTSLSERMVFLNMINFGEYKGQVTLLEKTEEKQEEDKNE